MKKIIGVSVVALFLSLSSVAQAQQKEDKSTGQEIKQGAKKAGNKTASVASKGKSKIFDQKYKDKVGPDGQTIYIDKHSKYYWVNNKGRKIYVAESSLKTKMD